MSGNRFSTNMEVKRMLTKWEPGRPGGPVLLYENGDSYVYDGELQTIVVGSTGCGKTRHFSSVAGYNSAKSGENIIMIDPKGENSAKLQPVFEKEDYTILRIDFKDPISPTATHCNILAYPYDLYHSGDAKARSYAEEYIGDLATILYPIDRDKEPFWAQSAQAIFKGCVFALFDIAPREQATFESVYNVISQANLKIGLNTVIADLVKMLPSNSPAAMQLQNPINCSASETRSCMITTALAGLAPFTQSEALMYMMSRDEVNISAMDGTAKLAIFIIVPDTTSSFDLLAGMIAQAIIHHLLSVADRNDDGRLKIRHNLIIEELGSVGKAFTDLPKWFMTGRSRGLRLFLILQSLSSLEEAYGKPQATAIRSSADLIICMRCNNLGTMKELSELCGERELEVALGKYMRIPLIRPTDIMQFQVGQALVILQGKRFIAELPSIDTVFPDGAVNGTRRSVSTVSDLDRPPALDLKKTVLDMKRRRVMAHAAQGSGKDVPKSKTKDNSEQDTDVDELVAEINKLIEELCQERVSPALQSVIGHTSLVLSEAQEHSLSHVEEAICDILFFPRVAAKGAAQRNAPTVLLKSISPQMAAYYEEEFAARGVRVESRPDEETTNCIHLSGHYALTLADQAKAPVVEALTTQLGFGASNAQEIADSLPCTIFTGIYMLTAQRVKTLLDKHNVVVHIDDLLNDSGSASSKSSD